MIVKANLIKTVLNLGLYYPQLVHEFIVNLHRNFDKFDSPDYRKIHVKEHCFVFFTAIVNRSLE